MVAECGVGRTTPAGYKVVHETAFAPKAPPTLSDLPDTTIDAAPRSVTRGSAGG